MRKVLFLGAGASKDADYPLMKDLFKKLHEFYKSTGTHPFVDSWNNFENYRSKKRGPIGKILRSKNPELVFTLPDILIESLSENEKQLLDNIENELKSMRPPTKQQIQEVWDKNKFPEAVKNTSDVKKIIKDYKISISNYFRHQSDINNTSHNQNSTNQTTYTYIDNMLSDCNCVITTNWDMLSENTLSKMGKWYPSDGYGFDISFIEDKLYTLQPPNKSQVKVLKLHGSIGWYLNSSDEIYIDPQPHEFYYKILKTYPKALQNTQINSPPTRIPLPDRGIRDTNCTDHINPCDPFLIYPSYLKQLDNRTLQSIWNKALSELQNATEIIFIGYSLPSADIAIRALLNPLRDNLEKNLVKIKIIIGKNDRDSKERWEKFLGDKVSIQKGDAKDIFSKINSN